MILAADTTPSQPWWLVFAGIVGTVTVAYLAARGPVWLEKFKNRNSQPSAAQKVSDAEDVLREWLREARRERDQALKKVENLNRRIDVLERELYSRGWDGRTA